MTDAGAIAAVDQPAREQPTAGAAPRGRCPTCGRRVRGFVDAESNAFTPVKTKSGVQKRFDQLTREKHEAFRQTETLRGDVAAAMAKLKQAEDLLRQYKTELEKYRTRFVAITAKEKQHGR